MSKQKLIVVVFPLLQSLLKQFKELADSVFIQFVPPCNYPFAE